MDAERIVVDYLKPLLGGVLPYYDVPADRPESFVVVEQTGGRVSDIVVETPTVDIQCWAVSRSTAASLAGDVLSAMRLMPDRVSNCFHASVISTFRDTDLESGTPRYHVLCEITLVNN